VTAEFMNNETGEIKSQTVFMGDFPLMTDKGTFIINGTERVVVSQLVRSPGRVLRAPPRQDLRQGRLHRQASSPRAGAWLEFEIDKKDAVGVRVDRKRKQHVTVLLKALGWATERDPRAEFGDYESMRNTLEKDTTTAQDDALLDLYRKLRPGEPPTREAAQTAAGQPYFNPKRYDLAKVGRYKINKKLGSSTAAERGPHDRRHRRDDRSTSSSCTPARPSMPSPGGRAAASRPTTSTTSATVACAPSASSSRTRSAPAWCAWSASSASA
jgi:DNA-directed RNA polymerase subunit beta